MTNSVNPDEMACYKPSNLDLHCLKRYLILFTGLKGLHMSVKCNFYNRKKKKKKTNEKVLCFNHRHLYYHNRVEALYLKNKNQRIVHKVRRHFICAIHIRFDVA